MSLGFLPMEVPESLPTQLFFPEVVIREGCLCCLDAAQRGFRDLLSSECDSPCGAVFEASLAVKVPT